MLRTEAERKSVTIGLLGAGLDTGNLGVGALAESSIKAILGHWPDAEIILLGVGYTPKRYNLTILDRDVSVETFPIRFSKNLFLAHHFIWLALYGLLIKIVPGQQLKRMLVNRNRYFRVLYDMDLAQDITAGDSFSDIYGFRRFFTGFLCKWLVLFLGKKLILLPQTYGPFERSVSKSMAGYILNRASIIYSRDQSGVSYVHELLGNQSVDGNVRFVPDVAFILDSRRPKDIDTGSFEEVRTKDSIVVGFNVNGLLFNGGYTQDNMFGLQDDYWELIYRIIELLMRDDKVLVVLIPHSSNSVREVENDFDACMCVYRSLNERYKDRLFLVQGRYDHSEIKYIIGECDLFIGSRMHSCIAAMSQRIPAVGLAYSRKFSGLFDSIGAGGFVADLREEKLEGILTLVAHAFEQRKNMAKHLNRIIPRMQREVSDMFEEVSC